MADTLSATIVHTLPGRIRVRLSRGLNKVQRLLDTIEGHHGIKSVSYCPRGRSIVVCYEPGQVRQQEIVIRIAVSFSLDYRAQAVQVLIEPPKKRLADSALLAGGMLAGSGTLKLLRGMGSGTGWSERLAATATVYAVLEHGKEELYEKGYFDPEVLSLTYLANSFLSGKVLQASLLTWLATFGRHLLELSPAGVEVTPQLVSGSADEPKYEIIVRPIAAGPGSVRFTDALHSMLHQLVFGRGHGEMMKELRDVTRSHDAQLEGMGWMPEGIPLRFQEYLD
jgi:hypothetical protein